MAIVLLLLSAASVTPGALGGTSAIQTSMADRIGIASPGLAPTALDPPAIIHVPVKAVRAGRAIDLQAKITDDFGVTNAWVKFRVGGGGWKEVAMGPAGLDNFIGTIPGSLVTSVIDYYLEAEDNEPQRTREPPGVNASHSIAVDTSPDEPPKITHSMPADFRAGSDLELTAVIRDEFGVVGAWVRFREIGRDEFAEMELMGSGENFRVSIPGRFVNPPGVEYYLLAEDDAGHVTASPSDPPTTLHKVTVSQTPDPLAFFEMRLVGVLPLWSILLLVLILVTIAAAGAAARARNESRSRNLQKVKDPGAKPSSPGAGPPKPQSGPSAQQVPPAATLLQPSRGPGSTGIAPISRASSSIGTPESEWGFPMGAAAGPQDTEPSLLVPGKRCMSCGAQNKFDAQWCGRCRSTLGGGPK